MKKKILLTFDYELFFKKAGTPENSVLRPTQCLLDKFKQHKMKATFFIDVLYLYRLRELKHERDTYDKIVHQLKTMVEEGHRVELHLHSHWLDAHSEGREWRFESYERYRLQSMSESEIVELFLIGTQFLQEIAGTVDDKYKLIAFRAGGWCIQPFEKLKKGFLAAGIYVDSSVSYGMKAKSATHYYDFSNAPRSEFYRFSDDPTIEENDGEFLEIPISSMKTNPLEKIIKRLHRRRNGDKALIMGDGSGLSLGRIGLLRKLLETHSMFTIEGAIDPYNVKRQIQESSCQLLTAIAHPKNVTELTLKTLDLLAETEHEFITIKEGVEWIEGLDKVRRSQNENCNRNRS